MSQLFERGYAVVVGVGADLPVTIADAKAIANILRDETRCAYPVDHVKQLTGDEARREPLLAALHWLAQAADSESTAVVYFSGHGLEVPDYHLMPFGYDLRNLSETAISGATFTECLRAIKAQKLLVLLDCCHAGGQAEAKEYAKAPIPPAIVAQLASSRGRVISASSRKDEVSYTGTPYSVYTEALLEGLAGYGAFDRDGYARVLDIAVWLGRKVPERTEDRQHPIIKVSNLEDNFAVAWYAGGEKTIKPLPESELVAPTAPARMHNAQLEAWRTMLRNYRRNLLLIERRMSEYVEFTAIPLDLIRNKEETELKISDLELKLSHGSEGGADD